VVEELVNGAVTRTYSYGYERISESQTLSHAWTPSFYIYDGRGTVRMLASLAATVTDTYEYDAFGNMLAKTGVTPNAYLYRGERYDADLKLYYLRARWYNPVTGRFMTRDPYSGSAYDPASLHRYNYARSNPANFLDPSGRATLGEYGLMFTNQVAKNVAVGAVGLSVNCMIRADAGILYLVGEFSHDNQTVIDAKADFTNCMASITVEQLTEATLFAWGTGVVLEELGGMLQEFLQGGRGAGAEATPTLFRGTSRGFPGNETLLRAGVTPTSTNPAVATIFATASEQYGEGVVQMASTQALSGVQAADANVLAASENEVVLATTPTDFAAMADTTISAADARAILQDMGYSSPGQISNLEGLNLALQSVPQLTSEEIQQFINAASEVGAR
jgi:RHS repeat-associated protein